MDRKIVITGLLFGVTAIILGAFGAHALKSQLDAAQLSTFETGVKYQMYHALLLLFVGTSQFFTERIRTSVFYFVMVGTLLFSGSIYLLATQPVTGINFRPFGIVTPIGGLLLIVGWILMLLAVLRKKS